MKMATAKTVFAFKNQTGEPCRGAYLIYIDRELVARRNVVPSPLLVDELQSEKVTWPRRKKIEQHTSKTCQRFEYLTLLNTLPDANKCERRGAREDNC